MTPVSRSYASDLPVIIAYLACACVSARLLFLLKRMSKEQRAAMWHLHATFLRLVFAGSVIGMGTWSANIGSYLHFFTSDRISLSFPANGTCPTPSSCLDYNSALALTYAWTAANFVFYPLEVAAVMCCKLLMVRPISSINHKPNISNLNPPQCSFQNPKP